MKLIANFALLPKAWNRLLMFYWYAKSGVRLGVSFFIDGIAEHGDAYYADEE